MKSAREYRPARRNAALRGNVAGVWRGVKGKPDRNAKSLMTRMRMVLRGDTLGRQRLHEETVGEMPNGLREVTRRVRQGAHIGQAHSHQPGAIWPAHLGARP